MIREIDLLSYLPPIVQEYREIKEVTATENPEFNLLWEADELIRNNIFFLTAEEQGLKRFEKIVGIIPPPDDTFESRRIRVFTRWNDEVPYTLRYLIGFLEVLTGGNYELVKNFDQYELEIITHMGQRSAVDDLEYIISTIIPANLVVISNNILEAVTAGNAYFGAAIIPTMVYMVTNDFEAEYAATGVVTGKAALIQTSSALVTNDFEGEYSMNGQANSGSNMGVTSEFLMTNDFETVVSVSGSAVNRSASVIVTEYQI